MANDKAASASELAACGLCGGREYDRIAQFDRPPAGESSFGLSPYVRTLWRCRGCGHFVNRHAGDMESIYREAYRNAAYGGPAMVERFQAVMDLPPERSDNLGRAAAVGAFAATLNLPAPPCLLDIGSGMAVFPAAMRRLGWGVTAIDPDPENARHAREVVGVEAICADFMASALKGLWDVVSLNKVLEHVANPIGMLAKAATLLASPGFVYIELPDGEAALDLGCERQEFFLEHRCAFSPASLSLLVWRAGLRLVRLERLREPSGKFTLRAFSMVAPS